MRSPLRRSARGAGVWTTALVWAALLGAITLAGCATPSSRDALWRIVSRCLDTSAPGYCAICPAPIAGACGDDRGCKGTLVVWAETTDYVAIRDIKMCGCPGDFVHGLALPRTRVTGVEDPRRPSGIWAFAWQTARAHIADEQQIALVVNPLDERTQDQLHVHLVRFAPGARTRLAADAPVRTADLADVWGVAARHAAARGLASYGVLVARDETGDGFVVAADGESPEYRFTAATCR